ncbi:MAG: hypothetical protein ACLR2C_11030, partial [Parasutterella excrementihominis]
TVICQIDHQTLGHCSRYSEPNIAGISGEFVGFARQKASGPFTQIFGENCHAQSGTGTAIEKTSDFDASRVSSLYQNDLTEIRVNALFGLNLIRAY